MTSQLTPYIHFRDTAAEALTFYQRVFGGELTVMTFGQMGVEGDEAEKIMHGRIVTEAGYTIMASDTPAQMQHDEGVMITMSLSGDDAEQLRGYFAALSEGADVSLPLTVQAWGDEFGMLTDRFGVSWLVNIETSDARREG